MKIEKHLPIALNWETIPSEKVNGETGFSEIQTQQFGSIKIRKVKYSENYMADHWCNKGHLVHLLEGELELLHEDKTSLILKTGMTYFVGDDSLAHKAITKNGAVALIID